MKYKSKALLILNTLENRLNMIENVIETNKPFSKDDLLSTIKDLNNKVQQLSEVIDLEYDDTTNIGIS